jgi:hypothetical protein
VLAKERVKANQGHPLPPVCVTSTAEESARTETNASFNTLILPHLRLEEELSQRLSLNRLLPPFESLAAMRPLLWPSIVFLKTMMKIVTKHKKR